MTTEQNPSAADTRGSAPSHGETDWSHVRIRERMREVFALDTRALALFRIGVACVILGDLASRSLSLRLYTDAGPSPRAFLTAAPERFFFSVHLLGGSVEFTIAMFALAAAVAFALLLGWHTRLMTAISLVLLISLQERSPLTFFGGDALGRVLLFWSLFLPLGARFSVDAKRSTPSPHRVVGPATTALFVQQLAIYAGGAVLKLDSASWRDASALSEVLRSDLFASNLGIMLRPYSGFLAIGTVATVVLELVGPLLFFVPSVRVRLAALLLFTYFQIGIWLLMSHGHFQVLMLVALLPFIPGSLIDRLSGRALNPAPPSVAEPRRARPIAWIALCTLIVVNVLSVGRGGKNLGSEPLRLVGLDQSWFMYRHPERLAVGYFVVIGTRTDGRTVNLITGESPATATKPPQVFSAYVDFRTRRLWDWLLFEDYAPFLVEVARWQCLEGAEVAGGKLMRVRAYFADERAANDDGSPYIGELFDEHCQDGLHP